QVADARYQAGEFQAAADLYASAAKVFEDPTLISRAHLGQGVSLLQAGNTEAVRAVLQAVALDGSSLDQTRGEAAYHLAVSYWEAGDTAKALEITDIVLQLDSAPFWVYRANALRERLGADAVSVPNS
ncbi:MAG TPA: tetratricopeptide repeat protein, partial [Oceanipulchritudo sp.]|nr:tetratricopeptide repeat protein [Oceanipulchritudo sp.]